MWKTVLKEIRMDKDISCCEEARMKIVEWFENAIEKLPSNEKSLKEAMITTSQELSEEPCEELYDSINRFMDMWDLRASSQYPEVFDADALQDIMDEWDDCKKESTKERNPAMDEYGLFQENPAGWMDDYIRHNRRINQ